MDKFNRYKLLGKLNARVRTEKESEFPDNPDGTGWGDQEGMLISTNEADYIRKLVEADLKENSHETCECGECKPDEIFDELCCVTGKFLGV